MTDLGADLRALPLVARRSRPTLATGLPPALLLLGAALLAAPWAVSESWRLEDPPLVGVAWLGLPFALLAVLAVVPVRPLRGALLAVAALDVTLVTLAVERWMIRDLTGVLEPAARYAPPATALALIATWGIAAHLGLRSPDERRATVPLLVAWAAVGTLALGAAHLAPVEDVAAAQTYTVLLASVAIEALPFVLLGALVSAALEVLVPETWFSRLSRLPLRLQLPAAIASGFCFPVCECGSVPVARRLVSRGVHPAAGVAFMLASPIVNPIVLASTYIAYQGRGGWSVVAARALLGVLAATVAAVVLGRRGDIALRRPPATVDDHAGHDHGGCDDGCGHGHDHAHGGRLHALGQHVVADLAFMGKFVVLGAALAAALQTAVPQSTFAGGLASPVVGGLVLMLAAFVLSLCSEADAFVAVSFIAFPIGPQLAFLVFGPIFDLKLGLLYGAAFGPRFVLRLVVVIVPFVLVTSLVAGAVIG